MSFHPDHFCIGRDGHGHFGGGRGGFFGGRSGGGFRGGGPGMRTAKVLASGDLQLIILLLLGDKPRPGMVYPALTYLEEMGYAAAAVEGTKKLYSITAEGTGHLNEHHAAATEVWEQLAIFGR